MKFLRISFLILVIWTGVHLASDEEESFLKKLLRGIQHGTTDKKSTTASKDVGNDLQNVDVSGTKKSEVEADDEQLERLQKIDNTPDIFKGSSKSTQLTRADDTPSSLKENSVRTNQETSDNSARNGTANNSNDSDDDDEIDDFFTSHRQDTEQDHTPLHAEWFMQTGRDFHGWRDELNFPGSSFLLDIIDEYLITEKYLEDPIKDPFKPDESLIASFASGLDTLTAVISDPDVLALIYTRRITAFIEHERMMCAASKFDMIAMKAMMMEISSLFTDDNESMQDFLLTLLLELPSVPGVQWDPNNVAIQLSLRIHDHIFNDTVHYLLGKTYRDVSMFSLGMYNALRSYFSSSRGNKDQFVAIVTDILYYDADVHCPTDKEMKMQRRDSLWDLTRKLEEVETIELCMGMRSFIEANFFSAGSPPSLMATTHDYEKTMQEMCDYVRGYVNHFYLHVEEYEHMLLQRNAEGLKALFQKYLSTDGLLMLVNVLETLRWIPNISVMDTVGITNLNWTLPADSVIENAQSDISYWQSFLDNLDPDTFTQMDLTDIKQVIQQWIDGKHRAMEKFTVKGQN